MKAIEDILYDWVHGFTGKKVIWEKEDSPSELLPYFTISHLSFRPIGEDFLYLKENSTLYKSVGQRILSISIKYYGRYGIDNLDSLYHSRLIPVYRNLLMSVGLTFKSLLLINNNGDLIDTEFNEFAVMDLEFYLATTLQPDNGIDLGAIDSIENTQDINNNNNISEYTVTIPVN
jgi:hypothetical protein